MDTIPWPPPADEVRLGLVLDARAVGDATLLKIRLGGGAETCTLVEEPRWAQAGQTVDVHYTPGLLGHPQIVRVSLRG
jgi:hypothetical protein